jgi:hypothetical protein
MQGKTNVLSQLAPDERPGFTNVVDVGIPRVGGALLAHLWLSSTAAIARNGISVWVESSSIESYPLFRRQGMSPLRRNDSQASLNLVVSA